jgi:hypothetical protein
MPKCIIEGCLNNANHNISIRCRRPNTSAIWSPNTNAYLCDEHAEQGCIIDVIITPTNTGKIETHISNGNNTKDRTTSITHHAVE